MSESPVGELSEVFQEDAEVGYVLPATVAVKVVEAVEIHQLPSVSGGNRRFTFEAPVETKKIAGRDPRRRIVRIWSDVTFTIGTDANECNSGYGALALPLTVLEITHMDEIWVRPSGAGHVSFIAENWAD
jgi:hypothetical protein